MAKNIQNVCNVFQMGKKYTNIFHFQAPKNLHQLRCFFGLIIYHLATLFLIILPAYE
jgi:hypothetical protein